LRSRRATELAYDAYRSATGTRATQAVWLIKHIAHPVAAGWIEEFLRDDAVAGWGVDALDQLLWRRRVAPEDVEHLLAMAERHGEKGVREHASFIRRYVGERELRREGSATGP